MSQDIPARVKNFRHKIKPVPVRIIEHAFIHLNGILLLASICTEDQNTKEGSNNVRFAAFSLNTCLSAF